MLLLLFYIIKELFISHLIKIFYLMFNLDMLINIILKLLIFVDIDLNLKIKLFFH